MASVLQSIPLYARIGDDFRGDINEAFYAIILGIINPLFYRGYLVDFYTQTYYLQSRVYMPAMGRFLNADAYTDTGTGLLGTNMFAYCDNNPMMYSDPTGYSAIFARQLLRIGARLESNPYSYLNGTAIPFNNFTLYSRAVLQYSAQLIGYYELGQRLPIEILEKAPSNGINIPFFKNNKYNRTAAIRYAKYWFKKRNDQFYNYFSDCANFVSQCLLAGGLEMTYRWHSVTDGRKLSLIESLKEYNLKGANIFKDSYSIC